MPGAGVFQFIKDLLTQFFGDAPPDWLLRIIAGFILFGLIILGIQMVAIPIIKFWREIIRPFRYTPEEKRQRLRRQRFADYMESEIRRINNLEAWSDNRFAELEAEVEAEGKSLLGGVFSIPFLQSNHLYKTRSLSKALERSSERLILLEGEPGSGKSVALRHVTQNLASHARKSRNLKSVIPIYINLKDLRRDHETLDRNLIENYVLSSLNRVNDRDIEDFLDEEFQEGIRNGTWLFLFDSFDEIPEVLSSTDLDDTVRLYAEAIQDFLHGFNQCRGIIASREYRGPRFLGWPKFRILALSSNRKEELVNRTSLPLQTQTSVLGGIALAAPDFQVVCSNPMFLNILCEFMRNMKPTDFPSHLHLVFEDYIWMRLKRDEDRLKRRFAVTPIQVKTAAERLAFCMTADTGIGLSPTKEQLEQSLKKYSLSLGDLFDTLISALVYLKIARSEIAPNKDFQERITFSHRRFQEYFATAVVIENAGKVKPKDLLLNAQWRETAVVLLQSKAQDKSRFLIEEASKLINDWAKDYELFQLYFREHVPPEQEPPWFPETSWKSLFEPFEATRMRLREVVTYKPRQYQLTERRNNAREIIWPPKYLHVLSILQDGMRGTSNALPAETVEIIGRTLLVAMISGSLFDKKWVLEVEGIAPKEVQKDLLLLGFDSIGNWVKDIAYKQITKLGELFPELEYQIKNTLVRMAIHKQLYHQRFDVYVHLSRVASKGLLNLAFILVWLNTLTYILWLISTVFLLSISGMINMPYSESLTFMAWSMLLTLIFTNSDKFINLVSDTESPPFFFLIGSIYILGCVVILLTGAWTAISLYSILLIFLYASINSWPSWLYVKIDYDTYSLSWFESLRIIVFPVELLVRLPVWLIKASLFVLGFTIYVLSRLHLYAWALFMVAKREFPNIRNLFTNLIGSWRGWLGTASLWVLIIIILFTAIVRLDPAKPVPNLSDPLSILLLLILGGLVILAILYTIYYTLRESIKFSQQYKHYLSWRNDSQKPDLISLIRFLATARYKILARNAIVYFRQNQQTLQTQKNLSLVVELINLIELVLSRKISDTHQYLNESAPTIREILLSKESFPDILFNSIILDELCKLYEQLETRS
jgi:hypothetical protein